MGSYPCGPSTTQGNSPTDQCVTGQTCLAASTCHARQLVHAWYRLLTRRPLPAVLLRIGEVTQRPEA